MSAEASLGGMLDALSRCLDDDSARRVIEFRVEAQIQERIDELINASDFVSILKLKTRRHLRTDAA